MKAEPGRKPGISRSQTDHHIKQQYDPHALKLREIEARLIRAGTSCVDSTYCPLRSLKKEFAYSTNSVRLHEYYFENIRSPAAGKSPLVLNVLARDFGSYEEWEEQFEALGLCARGWVVMGYDVRKDRVYNYITDSHAEGVWSVLPLLVLDVYEHAYCLEFQSRRDYVRTFLQSVDWHTVDRRMKAAVEMGRICRGIL